MSLPRQGLLLIVLAALAAVGWWWWSTSSPDAPATAGAPSGPAAVPVRAAEVRRTSIEESFEAIGTTRARQSVEVVSIVSGRVAAVLFSAGDAVRKGQPLIRLDSSLEEASLAEARALMADARSQLERARQLAATRVVPQARVDELQAAFAAAEARAAAAERRLSDRVVAAPFDGVVGLREVDVGARITDDTVLTRLDDLSSLELEFQVPEVFFGRVAVGQTVEATSAALPGARFTGTIVARDTHIDPVARAFRVRADLPNPERTLPPGLFMTATVTLARRTDALVIPEQAVVAEGRATYVFRIADGKAERVEVRLGLRRVGDVEVMDGLAPGDVVVTEGLQRLRPGVAVQVTGARSGRGAGGEGDREPAA